MSRHAYAKYLAGDTEWMVRARCAHSRIDMFPSDDIGRDHAKAVCANCPVQEVCLEYALTNRMVDGVWGGETEAGRRRILKARKAAG